jgi:pSer/pThr/pTyr-binding forkhead associated (FHA) protein
MAWRAVSRMGRQCGVGVLDSGGVSALRIRLPESRRDVLLLEPGVHALTPAAIGASSAAKPDEPLATVYVDSRGVWMQVRDGLRGAYVNGRPIRQMAMLRAGDTLFLHGHEVVLAGREPAPAPAERVAPKRGAVRCVLRAVGGPLHGRCFSLAKTVVIGNTLESDVRIDDARIAARHLELLPLAGGIALATGTNATAPTVNGHRAEDALLLPGDQLVLAGTHRFVIEAPRPTIEPQPEVAAPRRVPPAREATPSPRRRAWRVPWLLLAAVLLAGALSALLLYGAR